MTTEQMKLDSEFARSVSEMNGSCGAAWQALRKQALDVVIKQGIPTTDDEDWKYTSLSAINQSEFRLAARGSVSRVEFDALQIPEFGGGRLVLVNGCFNPELSQVVALDGVEVRALSDFLGEVEGGDARKLFNERAGAYSEPGNVFPALNTAFARDGVVVRVKRGVVCRDPIHIVHLAAVTEERLSANCPRHIVVLEENAEAVVVESFYSVGGPTITVHLTQLELSPGARCAHLKVQRERVDSSHISYVDATVGRDAHFSQLLCTVGGGTVRNEVRPVIVGSGSESFMRGLTVIGGKQHVDNTTVLDHAVPQAQSTEIFKGVFGGEATSAFSGTIIVRPGAQKTNAIQSNDSILLGDRATINTRPQLKIWADDVKCTHGATVGQMRDEALHYLRSRGIPLGVARQMLIEAFSAEVVGSIEHPGLRSWVEEVLRGKLFEVLGEA